MKMKWFACLAAALSVSLPATAAVVTLTFEGIANGTAIGNYYNGGGGAAVNYGVTFSSGAVALSNSNFSGEPSPSTVMAFPAAASETYFTKADGFDTGFYLYYSSSAAGGQLELFDDVDGKGNSIGMAQLPALNLSNCTGAAAFCAWDWVGVSFSGIAKSVVFTGTPSRIGFDNVTFGASAPSNGTNPPDLPEPTTLALVGLALTGLGLVRRSRAS